MISKSLSTSERWSSLHREAGKLAEFCQVLFMLLVTHADDHGRLEGSAFTIKHLVVPTSPRQESDVATALGHLDRVGLIQWYDADNGNGGQSKYIHISQFENHQTLRGREDRQSKHPDPPDRAQVRPQSPNLALREENLTKENLREENLSSAVPALMKHYHDGYLKRFGEKPNIEGGKDGRILKTLDKRHGTAAVMARIDRLLDSSDDWIMKSGRTIAVLQGCWNRLAGPLKAVRPAVPGCHHQPPCTDPAAHTKRDIAERRAS